MSPSILGIHHVTAIAGDAQQNVDFYVGLLGLRLVKRTVNFDDPGTYHLYYGDGLGSPGTILTFFPWSGAPRGRQGTGQATALSLSIPQNALPYWEERLRSQNVPFEKPQSRDSEQIIAFSDPDGLSLELVAHAGAETRPGWSEGTTPAEYAIRGAHSIALSLESYERTASLLTDTLGFRPVSENENRFRYESGAGGAGTLVDLLCLPELSPGRVAVGSIHHIAWRAPDDAQQELWREKLVQLGYNVSPVMDRQYFHSIYFREPGGVLFEIATDPPGFATDETVAQLGTGLKLPSWLEPQRPLIEQRLPPLHVPESQKE